MSINAKDIQPRKYKVTVNDTEYTCKPMKMSHKLGIKRIEPLLSAVQSATNDEKIELSFKEMSEFESELSFIVSDLVLELDETQVDIELGAQMLGAMFVNDITEDAKAVNDAGIEGKADPKVTKEPTKEN